MDPPDIAEFGRNFAVMVRIEGPDPKGLKMRRHAFHLHRSGRTTLSASGLLLPAGSLSDPPPIIDHIRRIHGHPGAVVVTAASVVEPFLTARQRNSPTQELSPELIPDAQIDVLFEGGKEWSGRDEPNTNPRWLPSQLLALVLSPKLIPDAQIDVLFEEGKVRSDRDEPNTNPLPSQLPSLVDVSASLSALLSLVGVHTGSPEHASWEVGWSLSPLCNGPQSRMDASRRQVGIDSKCSLDGSSNFDLMAKLATRIAFLGISTVDLKDVLHIDISQPQKRGDHLLVMGSPFGVLSPLHFFNSISVGSVANCCPTGSHNSSLLMADIRCLPGAEGGPVFDRHACLAGILTTPLRQKGSIAEIQLVITWDAIATAWGKTEAHRTQGELVYRNINSVQRASSKAIKSLPKATDLPCLSQSSFEKVMSSIVLVTVGDGVWASGIVLNNHGLILTNAHILEPWRFGRTSVVGEKTTALSVEHGGPLSRQEGNNGDNGREAFYLSQLGISNALLANGHEASLLDLSYRNYKKISIRLDHVEPKIWCDAGVVYVSRGPLDVALLQLKSVPDQLFAITFEFACPSKGLTVHVIGHGLLGPRSDICPSVSSGVLANVIRMPEPFHPHESRILETAKRYMPVMLQTTAAVHPGASGGAVVNSHGRMIGLVTSNARHGGGTIIPHMNFSIPCSALEPIFQFSETQDLSILQVLDKPNEPLSSLWALVPPSSRDTEPTLDKNYKQGRGSRFSKFLSEKHADFTSSVDRERLIKEKLPSKI